MKHLLAYLFFLIPLVWSKQLNANYVSAKTFLLYFASSLALLAISNRLKFRQIPKEILWLLVGIVAYQVVYYAYDFSFERLAFSFKFLSLLFVCLYTYSLNFKLENIFEKISLPTFFVYLGIFAITLFEIFKLRVLNLNIKTDVILSTFGNVNMFSEFVILTLPLLFGWIRFPDKIPYYIKLIFLFSVVFLLLYCRSRSAWIGLALWGCLKVYQGLKKEELLVVLAAAGLFLISHLTAPDVVKISKFTSSSFAERSSLYSASLELLADRPFGIQPGQFMNEIVPYLIGQDVSPNEYSYFDQPHSEFLKWGIQYGWLMLLLALALLVCIFLRSFQKVRRYGGIKNAKQTFFIESILVLLPQMAFQFPFENPASILYLGFLLALFLGDFDEKGHINLHFFKPFLAILSVAGMVNAFVFLGSVYVDSHYGFSIDITNLACKIYPLNFKNCFWRDKGLNEIKNYEVYRRSFVDNFKRNPMYCDNLRQLPVYFNVSGNQKKTCEALILYSHIFKNQKHFLPQSFEKCSGYAYPISIKRGDGFNEQVMNWFRQQ